MKSRFLLVLTLCLAMITTGFAQKGVATASKKAIDQNEQIKLDGKVRYGKLANGLTYYIKANKKPEHRAEFQIAINAGSVLEEQNEIGLAHFTEHMNFNGSKQFPGNTMIDELEKKGIVFGREINAYTGFDQTVYTLTLPTDDKALFDMGLKILDGWGSGALMSAEEIDKERGVIIEEWRMGQGGAERLRTKTWATMLKGSKYADRIPIGNLNWLQNFKYSDIRGFYKKWYRPDNMAVILVGDFDADEMEKKVIDFFTMTDPACTPTVRPTITIPDNKEPLVCVATDKEATSTSITFLYKHPSKEIKTIGDFREQKLVYGLFEEMFTDRLRELADKKDCPFINAYAGYGSFLARPTDAFQGYISSKEGKVLKSLEAAMTENQRLVQHGFLQAELDRAKEALLTKYDQAAKEESKTESGNIAAALVDNFLDQEPMPGARIENKYAQGLMDGITLEEVNALINKWITDDNFVLTVQMPEKKGVKIPTEKDLLDVVAKVKNSKTTPWIDNVKTEPFLVKEPKAGKITKTQKNEKFGYTEYTLSNGATVIIKPTTLKNDEITISAQSAGGSSLYNDDEMINVKFATNIIDGSGIGNYNNAQLMKFLKGKTVGLSPAIGDLDETISGSSSPADFETLLQYLYMYFEAPRKDKEVLDKTISQLETQINMVKNKPEFAFQEEWIKTMYPNDKRQIILPTEAQLKQMNIDKMYKIFRERFADASDFTFTFVGNIDEAKDLPLIEKYIGGMPAKGKKEQWKDRSTSFAKGVVDKVVYKGEADKGLMVVVSNKTFNWNDKERLATKMLNNVCSIKLTETIREEMGGTYSPYFQLSYEKYPKAEATMLCYYTCDPTTVDKLTTATFGVLDKIMNEGPTDEDIAKVKEQLIKGRQTQMQENDYWSSSINGSRWYGTQMQTIEEYTAAVNAITKADIQEVAKKYLDHKDYVRVSLKPEAMKTAK
ncbi:MAG: insulinase family protein [Bacteroidales bacterium]|jgi:zinc protease